jgi:hypothetical protein
MIAIYCRDRHGTVAGQACADCRDLQGFAEYRLAHCPFQEQKPTCAHCPIHCYRPERRAVMKDVMRHAGPRMLLRHPWLALRHALDGRRPPPPRPGRRRA